MACQPCVSGDISSVLALKMTVKVPSGLRDRDLARPVVEVRDYRSGKLAYEIYSFGQDTVIIPINPPSFKSKKRRRYDKFKGASKEEKISIDIDIKRDKVVLKADPIYTSRNIIVYAGDQAIFNGSLSRTAEINLSLVNKEGRRILKEVDRNKEIYGIIQ